MIILFNKTKDFQTSDIAVISTCVKLPVMNNDYSLSVVLNNHVTKFPATVEGFQKALTFNTRQISMSQI